MRKKAISIILAAAMIAAGLCACATQEQEAKAEPVAEAVSGSAEAEDVSDAAEAEAAPAESVEAADSGAAEAESPEAENAAAEAEMPADTGTEAEQKAETRPVYTVEWHSLFDSEQKGDGYLTYADGSYGIVRLTEEAKTAYPSLDAAITSYGEETASRARAWFGEVDAAARSYEADYQGSPSDFP